MTGAYNRQIFFDRVRQLPFGGTLAQSQVDGMVALLDYIDRLEWHPTESANQYFNYWNAYDFATTYHETAFTMQPITERGSETYLRGKPYYPWIGRGFVQMTWEDNYKRSDREIADGDLVSRETLDTLPAGAANQHEFYDQALNLEIASCNLMIGCWKGWWTGKKLWDYLRNDRKNYVGARDIVNPGDDAEDIAGFARSFEAAFIASWQSEPVEVPETELPPAMPPPTEPVETIALELLPGCAEQIYEQLKPHF